MSEIPTHPEQFAEFSAEQKSDRARQEALYLQTGITIEKAAGILPFINKKLEKEHKRSKGEYSPYYYFMQHPEYAFYLNSSDSLNTLYKVADVKDQKELLVHRENDPSPNYSYLLTQMDYPEMPVPFGVFRCIEKPSYDFMMNDQVRLATEKKGKGNLKDILYTEDVWTVEGKKP